MDQRANRVANALITEGIAPATRVAFLAKDDAGLVDLLFGAARADVVSMGINWRLAPPEVTFIINDAAAELLFVGEECLPILDQIKDGIPSVKKVILLSGEQDGHEAFAAWRDRHPDTDPGITVDPESIAVQMYTSGTTGHPKGVQLPHRSLLAINKRVEAEQWEWLDWSSENVSVLNIPLFHIGGLWWIVQSMTAGATCVLIDLFNAGKVLDALEQHKATKICMVPAMIQMLLSEPGCKERDYSALRHIVYGGSPIPPAMLKEAMETFGCEFFQIYGMTETGNCAVTLPNEEHDPEGPRLKAAGKALPGVSLKVIDRDGQPVAPGDIGEICINSPGRMAGYWKREEATANTLRGEWIHTGDAGYMDEDGYVFICDRVKDMIIYAGENVYPAEIENVLYEHPAVREVAVIGVPDERWGEAIKAVVVLAEGEKVSTRKLLAFAQGKIATFKIPKSVDFIEALPRTPSGKVRKGELRAPYWEGRERQVN